nr:unnamed protein product [Callosobruchus chinensis]
MEIEIQKFETCGMQNFGDDISATAVEMVSFQNDSALKPLFSNMKYIWLLASKVKCLFYVVLHGKWRCYLVQFTCVNLLFLT